MKQHTHPLDENSLMNKDTNKTVVKTFLESKRQEVENLVKLYFDEPCIAVEDAIMDFLKEAISENDLMWEKRVKGLTRHISLQGGKELNHISFDNDVYIISKSVIDNLLIKENNDK